MEANNQPTTFKKGQSVFLLGFMGTGKSLWGKQWAGINNMPFLDLDELIEQAEHESIIDIFEKKGEDHFREVEARMLREQCDLQNHIIACGGGTPCFHGNMNWMNQNGFTVYLSASPQFILNNVLAEKEKRPLVKNINEAELLFFIEQKLKERAPFYNQAGLVLDAENLSPESLNGILR